MNQISEIKALQDLGKIHSFKIESQHFLYDCDHNTTFQIEQDTYNYLNHTIEFSDDNDEVAQFLEFYNTYPAERKLVLNHILITKGADIKLIRELLDSTIVATCDVLECWIDNYNKEIVNGLIDCLTQLKKPFLIFEIEKNSMSNYKSTNVIEQISTSNNSKRSVLIKFNLLKLNLKDFGKVSLMLQQKNVVFLRFNESSIADGFDFILGILRNENSLIRYTPQINSILKSLLYDQNLKHKFYQVSNGSEELICCNSCWAKDLCWHSKFYTVFSDSPKNTVEMQDACSLIKKIIEEIIYRLNLNHKYHTEPPNDKIDLDGDEINLVN